MTMIKFRICQSATTRTKWGLVSLLSLEFTRLMQPLLGTEWQDFYDALHQQPLRAVRTHRIQMTTEVCVQDVQPFATDAFLAIQHPRQFMADPLIAHVGEPVPWARNGYYIATDSPLGKSVYHEAGAFYLQEPSAMGVVEAIDPKHGERILDLCAAPGGKCTEIGRRLAGTGLLVANEIHPVRVTILAQNLERLGIPAIVTQETPERLAEAWPEQFDTLFVDAPCSGEGMFRKDFTAIKEWMPEAPLRCQARQRQILQSAARLLRTGGRLVYSTCTFNPYENEQIIDWLVSEMGFEVENLPNWPGWSPGIPEWGSGKGYLAKTRRLWPHLAKGEGHFVARLVKTTGKAISFKQPTRPRFEKNKLSAPNLKGFQKWLCHIFPSAQFPQNFQHPTVAGQTVWSGEFATLPSAKLKVLRPGLPLARLESFGYSPHHAVAMAAWNNATTNPLSISETTAIRYCAGEVLHGDASTGYRPVVLDGMPLGFGKGTDMRVNNLYPKGLRKRNLVQLGEDVAP